MCHPWHSHARIGKEEELAVIGFEKEQGFEGDAQDPTEDDTDYPGMGDHKGPMGG